MKLEYNIVGVSKKSEEDLKIIYDELGTGVFALALSVTRSRKLAREIAVETFRRIVRFAATYNTDTNGQYWIMDICMRLAENSLQDPEVSSSGAARENVDNASALLQDCVCGLDGDRGKMVILNATTDLGKTDIAHLCGYYSGSARSEIRRGISALVKKDESREKKQILSQLEADAAAACPDYFERIAGNEPTAVAHVSHEAMYLPDEVGKFSDGALEDEQVSGRETERRAIVRKKRIVILSAVLGILLIAGIVTGIVLSTRKTIDYSGEKKTQTNVQFGNTIDMVFAGGNLFYRGASGGIYRYDPSGGDPVRIYDGVAKELVTDGTRLYFRSDRSKIFSVNLDGSGLKQLCSRSGTTLCFANGMLYFSASDGIYAMPGGGVDDDAQLTAIYVEEVDDAPPRNHIVVTENGQVLFSGGADKGIFTVRETGSGSLGVVYFDEVYYMTLWEGDILFDCVTPDGIEMYALDTERLKTAVIGLKYDTDGEGNIDYASGKGMPALTYSAAYCTYGDRLWYEGYVSGENGSKKDIGIYAIRKNSDEAALLLPIPEEGLHVSEMFCDGTNLYCFYSDGKSDGERRLVSYELDDFTKSKLIFEGRRG